jgi:hypothetical protein
MLEQGHLRTYVHFTRRQHGDTYVAFIPSLRQKAGRKCSEHSLELETHKNDLTSTYKYDY